MSVLQSSRRTLLSGTLNPGNLAMPSWFLQGV
jgi:hypothetical protein